MRPYLRTKNIKGSGSWKKDYHPRPKKKWVNWWENEFDNFSTRSTEKQKLRKEIQKELNFF